MEAYYSYLNDLYNKNRQDFKAFPSINWLNSYHAEEFSTQRTELIQSVGNDMLNKETKPYYRRLSEGCRLCGEGKWSCLFITAKCNARCFYCPARQTEDETPSTQSLNFETPEEYAHYVKYFDFKGVSFSGGEPLLYFDRTLDYLRAVRKITAPETYIWMYTNGILGSREEFKKLADAGLNEVRFDIGATAFRLDNIAAARGIVPNITIEIPAIPEETEKLKTLLPEIIRAGVTNLNLHQLRLTSHNATNLLKRRYTYFPSERPVVIESELAALEVLARAKNHDLDIGINYCSFDYKHRFQKAGFRKQLAGKVVNDPELITENGYIRNKQKNTISYSGININHQPANGNQNSMEIFTGKNVYHISTPPAINEITINDTDRAAIEELLKNEPDQIPESETMFKIWKHEYIERGLRQY